MLRSKPEYFHQMIDTGRVGADWYFPGENNSILRTWVQFPVKNNDETNPYIILESLIWFSVSKLGCVFSVSEFYANRYKELYLFIWFLQSFLKINHICNFICNWNLYVICKSSGFMISLSEVWDDNCQIWIKVTASVRPSLNLSYHHNFLSQTLAYFQVNNYFQCFFFFQSGSKSVNVV